MKEEELETNGGSSADPSGASEPEQECVEVETRDSAPETETGPEATGEHAQDEEPAVLSREAWSELVEKAAKADEHWDRLVRERAELENYKKRAARERSEAVKYANEGLIESLLPILDNFEMALLAVAQTDASNIETLKVGVEMIQGQLKRALEEVGLEEVDATGQVFDPKLHDALSQEASEDVDEGVVISQSRKGYRLKDRLIRPASVVVSQGIESEKPTEG